MFSYRGNRMPLEIVEIAGLACGVVFAIEHTLIRVTAYLGEDFAWLDKDTTYQTRVFDK
jgi:hypothetical protein